MGRKKLKVDYLMQYGDEIALLRDGLSLRRVRSRTGRAINTLRKLRTLFVIWIMDTFHPPQQPQSTHSSRTITIPQMTTVPTYAHRCNPSSPNATSRTTSTLGSLSAFFGVMQPDNRMTRHHFQKSETYFEITLGRKPVGPSRSKRLMNPERTGYGGQPESQPSTVEN